MTICTRRGCGVDFDASTKASSCTYHPGRPVFRDQRKSWSCCEDTNKPVLDFEDFVLIKGCAQADEHTDEKQALPEDPKHAAAGAAAEADGSASGSGNGGDAAGTMGTAELAQALPSALTGATLLAAQKAEAVKRGGAAVDVTGAASAATKKEEDEDEDEDPDDAVIPDGAQCKRTGCSATYSVGLVRKREEEECRHHPKQAIFHEGSKGYVCCKRRVLEFSEFLTIEPCTTSHKGHLFVGRPKTSADGGEEVVQCRMDHYETPVDIRLTVYAKGADMDKSQIQMRSDAVEFSVWLPPAASSGSQARRFKRTLALFSEIDPDASSFSATKFKIDLVLVKRVKGVSWPSLERSDRVVGYGLTFGRLHDAQTNAAH
ncbi:hypothetical protein OC842_001690 [Tilletia horrida]|uniref:Chord-domain-containing protein n=1 Tax=Tilletia horrida TaxID=155126 RepID=A0AAN6GEM0_9BASI|nr:hypothetical protein OC842_001690 [Tilletia horrida]